MTIIMSLLLTSLVVLCLFSLCVGRVENVVASSIRGSMADDVEDVPITRKLNLGDVIPGSYIVTMKESDQHEVHALDVVHSLNIIPDRVFHRVMKGFAVKGISEKVAKKLAKSPGVASVTPDIVVGLATSREQVLMDDNAAVAASADEGGQTTPWGIRRVKGGVTYTGDNVVWVLDTGIQLDHEDLNVDASRCHSIYGGSCNDDNGHGTHVAGIIAAIDNGIGVIGVAAGATVIPVKVLDEYANGSAAGAMAGIEYVMTHGKPGDVANMSLGTRSPYAPLDEAVANAVKKGIRFVLAAGNDSVDTDSQSPARVHADGVYTVSGMKYGDRWLDYSNYGSDAVNYCAPGDYVYSTYKNNTYAYDSGTSMAAPHVAGILLLNSFKTDGHVRFDPDGSPDPILVYNGPMTRHT